MLLVNPQKLTEFEDQLGYEQVFCIPDPDVGVVADWDGVKEFLPTQGAGWEAFSEDVYVLPSLPTWVRKFVSSSLGRPRWWKRPGGEDVRRYNFFLESRTAGGTP
ncbi:hypothetical protein [Myxococcus vastator]|uniref:hypothetical protein n=1 Tax=Myxococcus vastator TaxID=2709664 RepID=UPI0013D6F149|nr:hypothetical protein [Myxococcus vastator]